MSSKASVIKMIMALNCIDRSTKNVQKDLARCILESVSELSPRDIFDLAYKFCVYEKPLASEKLFPIIEIELMFADMRSLIQFLDKPRPVSHERLVLKELKEKGSRGAQATFTIGNRLRNGVIREEFLQWFFETRQQLYSLLAFHELLLKVNGKIEMSEEQHTVELDIVTQSIKLELVRCTDIEMVDVLNLLKANELKRESLPKGFLSMSIQLFPYMELE